MEPFYFGEQGRRLFAHYHTPTRSPRAEGVVIAPPLFAEYFRSHSCLRQVALGLAGNGLHVLRFDYFGTGDSEGDFEDTLPKDWENDLRAAISELVAISGVRKVGLVGVRLGATLAARVALSEKIVSRIAMWDPIVDGAAYVEALRNTHRRLLEAHSAAAEADPAPEDELVGVRVSANMLADLGSLTMPAWDEDGLPSALLLLTRGGPVDPDAAERARTAGVTVERVAFDCDWQTYSESVLFLPHEIVRILTGRT